MSDPKKKILVCGVFDCFHAGHVQLLEGASRFGEVTVAIADDVSIRVEKGEGRPKMPAEQRLQILLACKYVAFAKIFAFDDDPYLAHRDLVDRIKPDAYAEGRDHNNLYIYPVLEDYGIPRLIVPGNLQSTTNILEK